MGILLKIENLHVAVRDRLILKGVNLEVGDGEVHVIFGPNGSGKSTLAMAIMGHPEYRIVSGRIIFDGEDITEKPIDERARMGISIAFQNPPKLHGIRLKDLLARIASENGVGEKFLEMVDKLNISREHLSRYVNVGFSGGEIKRCEIAQALASNPKLLILDEPDSGVDVENLELIGRFLSESLRNRSALIITHHGHILRHLKPMKAHVLIDGMIACEGDPEQILSRIMRDGYRWCERCRLMRGG
ncbi:MAG: Fe-S cluster assembly ATPase SufC [Nitrososphaerota archaeon]